MLKLRAVAFDTGGTVLDWHSGIVHALAQVQAWATRPPDPHAFANVWRKRTLLGIVGQRLPDFDMDDVHLRTLRECVNEFQLPPLNSVAEHQLWRCWHRLHAWPGVAPCLNALRTRWSVVSFTMLPLPLVLAVSRANALPWDAVLSCQMIGVYKPHAEAYQTAVRWLGLRPHEVLMVACHNFDLHAAQDNGMRTAFVRRPLEWGPEGPPDPHPNRAYDWVVDDFEQLSAALLA